MKKKIKWIVILVLLVAFVCLQFVRPDISNPPINESETLEATTQVPENVSNILTRSCNDCHTNKTVFPWYSNVTPISWTLANHIKDGRRHLNFSVWNTYDKDKRRKKLREICDEVSEGFMPIGQYLWLHGNAVLSKEDVQTLCDWTQAEAERIAAPQNPQ
jgi:Haem-binding domain